MGTGNQEFIELEAEKCQKFDIKEKVEDFPVRFGGTRIDLESDCLSFNQLENASSLKPLNKKSCRERNFAHLRGQLGYTPTSARPEVACIYASAAHTKAKEAQPEDERNLNCAINHLQKYPFGILFPHFDISSISILGYSDAGFASNSDLKSQLGMITFLMDKFDNAYIFHNASRKSNRVMRSVLAAEFFAFVACNDFSQILLYDLCQITRQKYPVFLMTDSKSIFDTITKLSCVGEKRMMIVTSDLRQSYSSGEITNVDHVL